MKKSMIMTTERYVDEICNMFELTSNLDINFIREILNRLDYKWISVESELPLQEQGFYSCFTFGKDGNRRHSQFNCLTKNFQTLNFDVIEVTHWMPLPDKPILTNEK